MRPGSGPRCTGGMDELDNPTTQPPRPPQHDGGHAPDPTSWKGALFYAVAGGLIASVILAVLHHIHLVWS